MLVRPQLQSVSFITTGVSHKIGEVHDGAATMDWMEQEQSVVLQSLQQQLHVLGISLLKMEVHR